MMRNKLCWLVCLLSLSGVLPVCAQDAAEEVERVRTRIVVVDALVQDKKTGEPLRGLTLPDFEILDEGKPRTLTYFSRAGDARPRPLALVLVLDLEPYGTGEHLQRPEILQSLRAALEKLGPQDEVALVGDFLGMDYEILSGFTSDRAQTSAALATVPQFVRPRNGSGKKSHDDFHSTLKEVTRLMTTARPNSQGVIVHLSNMLFPILHEERSQIATNLNRGGVTYHALTYQPDKFQKVLTAIVKPVGMLLRASFTGTPGYLARRTGGEALRVPDPGEYGAALENIIGKLSARYSLGFTLKEDERDDGQMRRLEVRLSRSARDRIGRDRKLTISAREGYFVPLSSANLPRGISALR